MQSSVEEQGEIRMHSSEINAKKWRKTIKWERRDLFGKTGDIKGTFYARDILCKDGPDKEQKW